MRSRDDGLDLEACARLVDYQLDNGTRALVVAGSTGEAAALDDAEYSALIEFVVARVAGRVPVLAGTGQSATAKTIAQTRRAKAAGADAALVVVPAYVRPTQAGMTRHFHAVADDGGLPVVLYNVPARTGSDLLPATVAGLAEHGNIVGIKEALPDPRRMQALLALKKDGFRVLSGDDPTAAHAMRAGADGVISVAANVAPKLFSTLCDACLSGDAQAAALDDRLQPLYAVLGAEPNPIPLKWCLSRLGLGEAHLRLPLLPLSEPYHAKALDVLNGLGLNESGRHAVG